MSGEEIGIAVLVKFVEELVGQATDAVRRQFSYLFCYKRNARNLRTERTKLNAMKADLEQRITVAFSSDLETTAPPASLWLEQAEEFTIQALGVQQRASDFENGCRINLIERYALSRKAAKLVENIGVHIHECASLERISLPALPLSIVDPSWTTNSAVRSRFSDSFSTPRDNLSVEMTPLILQLLRVQMRPLMISHHESPVSTIEADASFISRRLAMQKVMDALMTDGVNMIGLFGMGGVGKTTLVNEIREKVKAQKLFSEMAMAEVSQHPDLFRIQGELAEKLGLNYQELTSVDARKERLRERLTKGAIKGGRVLVILDNIWGDIELDKLGIPVSKSCKVIFTTRNELTCIQMRAQATIKVSILSNEESWNLFKKTTGDCVENESIEGIAREVASECGGLPLAIVTLGKALAGKVQQRIWADTLYQLGRSAGTNIPGMHEKVHSSIELSYNFLQNNDLKSLLLICCLFQEHSNIPIERLVRYCFGLHLFPNVETMERTRSRVYSLVDHLKSSSLLLDGGTEPLFQEEMFVKMHDVVRDVCQSIASKEPFAYLVRHDRQLNRWPHNDTPNTHSAISLMSDVLDNIPDGIVYQNLKILQLQLKRDSIFVSSGCFQGMKTLRVLDFQEWSFGGISACLPETQVFLKNLRILSLEHCSVANNISVIGSLEKLEVLSFFMSSLDNLPREVGQLINLKVLDLRCKNEAPVIIASILSCLNNLEELYMGSYDSWKGSTEEEGEEYYTSITELDSLPCLTTLQIQVQNPGLLLKLKDFDFGHLQRFNISTRRRMRLPCQYAIVNSLYLEGIDIKWLSETQISSLVKRSEILYLTGMKMSYILGQHSIVKILHLRKSDEFEFIRDAMDAFPNLERLHIEEMDNLIEISHLDNNLAKSFVRLRELELFQLPALTNLWNGRIHTESFGNLTFIQISHCVALKILFTQNVAICLAQLQDLFIFQCDVIEGVISDEGSRDNNHITFPKLNYLWFDCLPEFGSLFPVSGSKESLLNQRVSLPNLDMLRISNLDGLKQIVGGQVQDGTFLRFIKVKKCHRLFNITDSALLLQNLEDVVVEDCEEIESVFGLEGLQVTEEDAPVILSNLETIELNNLPRLTDIWRMVIPNQKIKGLENLRTLDVWECHSLRYILPLPIAKLLVNLHDLTLGICNSMEEVIGGKEEDSGTIVFPQLQVLKLLSLNNFISFSSSSNNLEFPSLQKTEITKCPKMTVFCSGLVESPIVEEPVDDPDINEWIWQGNLNNGINRGSRRTTTIDGGGRRYGR